MVGLGRFELPTSPLSGVRSNQLSYRPSVTLSYAAITQTKTTAVQAGRRRTADKSGGARRDRTDDPLLAKQVLSQLSYGPLNQARSVFLRKCVVVIKDHLGFA
jgi:hypothetical protein